MSFEKVHTCPKSHNKIVSILTDFTGNTYCVYCGQKVNYIKRNYIKRKAKK